jgi:broad specificity phosphatase PhoE
MGLINIVILYLRLIKIALMSRTLWIARHGNRLDFVYPEWFETASLRYDPPLSEDGQHQVQHLAHRLQSEAIAHVFCSPFLRAIQTAHPIATALDLPLNLEAGLGEWHNPDWMTESPQTHVFDDLKPHYPRINDNYRSYLRPQYPETESQLRQRLSAIAHHLVATYSENLLLVGHSATVMWITAALLPDTPLIRSPLCCLVKLVHKGDRWHPELLGDTTHLQPTESSLRLH